MERGIAEGLAEFLVLGGLGVVALLALLAVGIALGVQSGKVRALTARVEALEGEVKRLAARS